jgi:hypothetical protein
VAVMAGHGGEIWCVRLILAERADASKPRMSARRWQCCLREELDGDGATAMKLAGETNRLVVEKKREKERCISVGALRAMMTT